MSSSNVAPSFCCMKQLTMAVDFAERHQTQTGDTDLQGREGGEREGEC